MSFDFGHIALQNLRLNLKLFNILDSWHKLAQDKILLNDRELEGLSLLVLVYENKLYIKCNTEINELTCSLLPDIVRFEIAHAASFCVWNSP